MPRMWADKTIDELREEWQARKRELERRRDRDQPAMDLHEVIEALEAIELEIGRRRKPLVDAGDT